MSRRAVYAGLTALFGVSLLGADMVTTRDHKSVNGSLTTMANGEMQIVARYQSGEKTITIKLADTEAIEFNNRTFNAGPPAKSRGLGPGSTVAAAPPAGAQETPGNKILLQSGQEEPCTLRGIDEKAVHCAEGNYDRRVVIRILVGGR